MGNPRDTLQPSHEKVKPLIEFDKSVNYHYIYRSEKHNIHIVQEVLTGLVLRHQDWSRTKSPIKWKRETIIICSTLDMTEKI